MLKNGTYGCSVLDAQEGAGRGQAQASRTEQMAEDDDYVYLDSYYASKRLIIIRGQSCLESFVYSGGSIQTTRAGVQLHCLGTGKFRVLGRDILSFLFRISRKWEHICTWLCIHTRPDTAYYAVNVVSRYITILPMQHASSPAYTKIYICQ